MNIMIYESNNVYYLKKGNDYEIASLSLKYNRRQKRNVLVITGTGDYVSEIEEPIQEYSFKELANKLCEVK